MFAEAETNLRSTDRVLSVEPIDGKAPLSSLGMVDHRLFTGEQKLHLKMDPQTCLWYFQYANNGLLPEPLKGRFTGFKAGLKFAEEYFKKRNIKVTQVKD
jgi:hypothetical protein